MNGRILMVILQCIEFLGRQGLALRGHIKKGSNFIQLMKLRSLDLQVHVCYMHTSITCILVTRCIYDTSEWLQKKGGDKYVSPEIQNEILALMSHAILRN